MDDSIHINFQLLEAHELPEDERSLLRKALEISESAYVPYSKFQVGCALQMADGEIIRGNNQENAAFPSGLCAERNALFYAGAHNKIPGLRKMAIRANSLEKVIDQPVTPCGACRQVMLEYERIVGQDIVVLMQGKEGKVLKMKGIAKCLLPFGFDIAF
ncbi:MAG: cytidine deaminase [Bacteroidota bacterium]